MLDARAIPPCMLRAGFALYTGCSVMSLPRVGFSNRWLGVDVVLNNFSPLHWFSNYRRNSHNVFFAHKMWRLYTSSRYMYMLKFLLFIINWLIDMVFNYVHVRRDTFPDIDMRILIDQPKTPCISRASNCSRQGGLRRIYPQFVLSSISFRRDDNAAR